MTLFYVLLVLGILGFALYVMLVVGGGIQRGARPGRRRKR